MSTPENSDEGRDWLQPPAEQEGLQRYVETIRERLWLIAGIVAITTGVALLYVFTAAKTYQAETDMLITPVPATDNAVLGTLGLITQSSDPTRDVETASKLIINVDVAERVKKQLNSPLSAQELLAEATATPVAQSNIVAVTATESSPEAAQALANAFAEQGVLDHTETMRNRIDAQVPLLQSQATSQPNALSGTQTVQDIVNQLELVRSGPAPDISVQTKAPLPTSQASPKPVLSVAAGIIGGLILGVVAAFSSQVLDPRLRREAQLRRAYRLPILGRIPRESQSDERPLGPRRLSAVTSEAYRTLRSTLTAHSGNLVPGQGRVILITGSGPSEGKTTSAVSIATSLALSGKRVILIEADLRRPVLGNVLGVTPPNGGVVSVLIENTTLSEALVPTDTYGPNLQLLLADYEGGWIAELFSISTAERMIAEARAMADYVIIDSPPLNEVVDALPLARLADDVLIVVRLGTTRLDKLNQLAELLAENGVKPVGFAVIGTARPKRGAYHYHEYSAEHTGVEPNGGGKRRRLVGNRGGS